MLQKKGIFFLALIFLFQSCSLFQGRKVQLNHKMKDVFETGINQGNAYLLFKQLNQNAQENMSLFSIRSFLGQVKRFCGRVEEMGDGKVLENTGTFTPQFSIGKCYIKYSHDENYKLKSFLIKSYQDEISQIKMSMDISFVERAKKLSEHYFKKLDLVGMTMGLIENGKVSYFLKGHHQFDKKIKMSKDSVFEVGSLSKVFTAVLFAHARLSNLISSDQKIEGSIPKLSNEFIKKMSLENLITHRSGLPRLPKDIAVKNPNPYAYYGHSQMIGHLNKNLKKNKDESQEKKVLYSNLGVALLTLSLEGIYEKSYDELINELIVKKIKLKNTSTYLDEFSQEKLAKGHIRKVVVPHWTFEAFKGAGGIYSSIEDMTKFVKSLFTMNGQFKTYLDFMIKKSHRLNGEGPALGHRGIYSKMNSHKQRIYWHNGKTGGFSSFLAFDLEKKRGVILLSNSYGARLTELGLKIVD